MYTVVTLSISIFGSMTDKKGRWHETHKILSVHIFINMHLWVLIENQKLGALKILTEKERKYQLMLPLWL